MGRVSGWELYERMAEMDEWIEWVATKESECEKSSRKGKVKT